MKIVFDHIQGFGKVCHQDFIYSNPVGHLEDGESAESALEAGWIPWDGVWYNLRSVRIDLSQYKPGDTTRRLSHKIDFIYQDFQDKPLYWELYDQYCEYHGFERLISWDQLRSHHMISYSHNNQEIGFSSVRQFDKAMVAFQFVWDYKDPKLSLGKVAQLYECEVAKMLGCSHVYILGGYEKKCLYKSDFHGFEWWTGTEWSKDKALYQELCMRDENIKLDGHENI